MLLVDLDCHRHCEGTAGVLRVDVGLLPYWLMLLESSNASFSDLKNFELAQLDTHWTEEMLGYSGSKLQLVGYRRRQADRTRGETFWNKR